MRTFLVPKALITLAVPGTDVVGNPVLVDMQGFGPKYADELGFKFSVVTAKDVDFLVVKSTSPDNVLDKLASKPDVKEVPDAALTAKDKQDAQSFYNGKIAVTKDGTGKELIDAITAAMVAK